MENILGIDDSLLDAKVTQDALDFSKDVPQLPPQGFDVNIEKTPTTFGGESNVSRVVRKPKQIVTKDTNKPNPDPLFSAIADATQNHYNRQANDIIKVSSYNPDIKERYKKDASLYHDYFDPKSDNERVAAENWDKWDAISAGLGRFKDSFANSFGEAAYTWVRAGKALFNGDVDYLSPSATELNKMAYEQHRTEIENPIFYKPGTENDFLTKGFLAETMGNIGFTFGTIGEVITEQLVSKAIEGGLAMIAPATGGGSLAAAAQLEATTDISTGLKIGKLWKNISKLFTARALNTTEHLAEVGSKTGKLTGLKFPPTLGHNPFVGGNTTAVLRTLNGAETVVSKGIKYGDGFWDHALKLATYVPFAGELAQSARIAKAGKNILTSSELFKVGVGGLRRSFAEWQMAAGEAAIEAGGNYADLYDQFKDEFRQRNGGQEAIGEDLLRIKKLAMESATLDFGTNVAILGITNKIQWGNMVGNFGYESKAINAVRNSLAKEASELGITVVSGTAKETGKQLTKGYMKSTFGMLGLLPKIASDFSAKQAAWEYGKSMLRGLTRIELSEGLQENFQEIASVRLKDYYTDIYRGDPADWGKSFNEAVNSQISKQGLKTFLSGALTGLFIGPAMNVISNVQTSKYLNPNAAAHKESVKRSLEQMNNYFKQDSEKILKEAVKQIKLQTMYNDGMLEGILNKDKYQHGNNYDSSLIQTIMHAKRTGTLGYLMSHIKGYGENFTDEEFKSAFGFSPEEIDKGMTPQDVMNNLAKSSEAYSEIWDKYQDKYGLLLDIADLIEDPARKQKFSVRKAALMDAIGIAAFIESKSKASIKRASEIKQRIINYESIGNSLHTAWSTITNAESIDDSLLSLRNEIKIIREGVPEGEKMDEKTQKLLNEKELEFTLLSEVRRNVFTDLQVPDPNDPTKTIKVTQARFINSNMTSNQASPMGTIDYVAKAIGAYLSLKNKQAGLSTVINNDEVQNAALDMYHYMALGQDHSEYVDAVNLLNDPDNFGKHYQNLMDARAGAHARLLYDSYMKLGSISEVARKFLEENKELTDELLQFSKTPLGTFDNMITIQNIANKLNEKFDAFQLEKMEADKKEAETEEGKKKAEAEKQEKISKSKLPKPIISMLAEVESNPEKAAEIAMEVNEYMAMRYDLEHLEKNFPYNSTDPAERTVVRYYLDSDGKKQPINPASPTKIPVVFVVQKVDEDTGEIIKEEVPIDSFSNLLMYLYNVEEAYHARYQKTLEANTAQTAAKTEAADTAKSDLENFVGQKVVLNGNLGTLEIENDKYVVKFEDGSSTELAPVSDTKVSFNDFTELSVALESLPQEHKEVMMQESSPVIDVHDAGAVQIEMDSNLSTVTINGVTWDIEYGTNGLAVGFSRTFKKAKNISRRFPTGEKIIREKLSGKNSKAKEYLARVNNILMNVTRPLPTNETELTSENEAYDVAINEAKAAIENEATAKERSDELLAKYQVNRMKNQEIPDDILEIKWIFDNPLRRDELTSEQRIKLYIWASDLVNQIKKHFRIWTTNKVVNSAITELQKEYINPISELDNAAIKPGSKTVTERTSAKKERAQKSTKGGITREGRSDTAESQRKSRPKKGRKRGVAQAVNQIDMQFDNQLRIDFDGIIQGPATSDPFQDIISQEEIDSLFEITPSKIQSIQAVIPQAEPVAAGTVTDVEAQRLEELSKYISEISVADNRRPDGSIGTQGFSSTQMKDLIKFLNDKLKLNITESLFEGEKLKPIIDFIKNDKALVEKIKQYVKTNPIEISRMPDGSLSFRDGNHRANLLNLIGSDILPVIEVGQRSKIDEINARYDALKGKPTSVDVDIVRRERYYNRPANKMVKSQKESNNTDLTQDEIDEIEAVIEKAKEIGWDKDRLLRKLNAMGYVYDIANHPEAFRNYLEDRLSGKTNIKVTSEYNFFKQLDAEIKGTPVSTPAQELKTVNGYYIYVKSWEGYDEMIHDYRLVDSNGNVVYSQYENRYGSINQNFKNGIDRSKINLTDKEIDKLFDNADYNSKVRKANEDKQTPAPAAPVVNPLEDLEGEMRDLYQRIEMEEMKAEAQKDETIFELKVLRYMPKITPESARAETGVKTGTKSDIHISLISKKGVTVDTAAQAVWVQIKEDLSSSMGEDMDDFVSLDRVKETILDILETGSKAAYEAKYKGSSKELKQLKARLKEVEDKYNKLANPDQTLIDNPFQSLINKLSCEI